MNRADTCNWYNELLEVQLCWYFKCSKEDLLTMLDGRTEEIKEQKEDDHLFVSFKTAQQTMPKECIMLVFRLPLGESPQFKYLHDWYYTDSLPEYRFGTSAPNPEDSSKLHVVGGGF